MVWPCLSHRYAWVLAVVVAPLYACGLDSSDSKALRKNANAESLCTSGQLVDNFSSSDGVCVPYFAVPPSQSCDPNDQSCMFSLRFTKSARIYREGLCMLPKATGQATPNAAAESTQPCEQGSRCTPMAADVLAAQVLPRLAQNQNDPGLAALQNKNLELGSCQQATATPAAPATPAVNSSVSGPCQGSHCNTFCSDEGACQGLRCRPGHWKKGAEELWRSCQPKALVYGTNGQTNWCDAGQNEDCVDGARCVPINDKDYEAALPNPPNGGAKVKRGVCCPANNLECWKGAGE